jgi:PhnB protein
MAGKANPIPEGFHSVTPHLIVRDAAKAIEWYGKAFGAKERFRMPGPDGRTIMHAEIQIGNSIVMMGEENPSMGCSSPKALNGSPVTMMIYTTNCDQTFQQAVSAGATANMPPMDMFWGDRYGRLTDPFGHQWAIATHQKDLTPQEIEKGQKEFFAQMAKQPVGAKH